MPPLGFIVSCKLFAVSADSGTTASNA